MTPRRIGVLTSLLAIGVGAAIALSMRATIREAVPANVHAHAPGTAAAARLPEPPIGPEQDAEQAPPLADEQATPVDPPRSAHLAPVREPGPENDALAEARAAILDATPRALVTGKPAKWKAGPLTGYVVPSAMQQYADRSCRNIFATTISGQSQDQGASQRWCRPLDGDGWAPE